MQTKTKLYAHTTTGNSLMDGFLPTTHCTGSNNGLSNQEKELYKALCKVSSKTLWGAAIQDCLQRVKATGNYDLFRELSMSLYSQLLDEPDVMKNILGTEAYTVLSHRRLVTNGALVVSLQVKASS